MYIRSHNSNGMSGQKPSHEVQGTLYRPLWYNCGDTGKKQFISSFECSQVHSGLNNCEMEECSTTRTVLLLAVNRARWVLSKNPTITLTELWKYSAENLPEGRPSLQHSINHGMVLLRKRHMTACLEFAKWHLKIFESMRKKIIWSDETKILLWAELQALCQAIIRHCLLPA